MPALVQFVALLPSTLRAAVLVVQHFAPDSNGQHLVDRLARHTVLPCRLPTDGEVHGGRAPFTWPRPTATCWPKTAPCPTCS